MCGCHAYVWEHESSLLVRALGLSSWSENSTTCQTTGVPAPPFDYFLYVIVPLVALLGCVIVGFVVHVFTNLSKVIAPKLRRRDDKPIISEFVSSDMTPMEEHDPELVMNPILVHKMKRNEDKKRKEKLAKKAGATGGKTGGLARLGLRIDESQPKVDPKKLEISAVDTYLERSKNVFDASKGKSAYEREVAGKALAKGARKAQVKSSVNEALAKSEGRAEARVKARQAVDAARQGVQLPDMPEEEGGGGAASGRRHGKGNLEYSAVL